MVDTAVEPARPKKIGGYDRYDVEDGVRTMRRAAEIEKDPKFLAVVVKEMNTEADDLEKKAKLLVTTSAKLKKSLGRRNNDNIESIP